LGYSAVTLLVGGRVSAGKPVKVALAGFSLRSKNPKPKDLNTMSYS